MELLHPTRFSFVVASSKEQLKKISFIVSKYCGKAQAENFLNACDTFDFTTANNILDDTVKELTGQDSVSLALNAFVDKFPQLSPDLDNKVSDATSEVDKIKAINSYRSKIINIIDGM